MKKAIIWLILSLFFAVASFGQENEPVSESGSMEQFHAYERGKVLVWGVLPDYEPNMMFINNQPTGFMVDVLSNIMDDLNIPNRIVVEDFSTLYPQVLSGEIHLFPSLLRTPDREDVIYWPDNAETMTSGWGSVIVKHGHLLGSILELQNQNIGVVRNDATGEVFQDFMDQLSIPFVLVHYSSFDSLVEAIVNEEVMAGVAFSSLVLSRVEVDQTPIVFNPVASYSTGALTMPDYAKAYVDAIHTRLTELKNDPDSYYYELQEEYLIIRNVETAVFPQWLILMLIVFVATTVLSALLVRVLTRKLRSFNHVLEERIAETKDELEKAHEQLVQSEKMSTLAETIAGVAHEINTPLGVSYTAITLASTQMKNVYEQYKEGNLKQSTLDKMFDETGRSFKLIEMNLKRAADLIRTFKKVTTAQANDELREVEIPKYYDEVWESIKPKYRKLKKQIEWQNTITDTDGVPLSGTAMLYPGKIAQVIINVVDNAIDHGFEGLENGIISHHAIYNAAEGYFMTTFTNTGNSIPEEELKKVLEPFYTTKVGKDHSGLGLPIIYRLIHEMWPDAVEYFKIENREEGGVRIQMKVKVDPKTFHLYPSH